MSILDSHPLLKIDMESAAEGVPMFLDEVMKALELEDTPYYQAIKAGATPAAALGLESRHIEALYQQGYDLLAVGEIEKARAILTTLLQLDPSEERGIYALAATYQMEGRFDVAAQIYTTFITMDATNPDGYLRLGECLEAIGETENAAGCYEIALGEAERGHGSPESLQQARAKWAIHGGKQ
ncbi:tetratricopeptide repeat protein [Rhizobium alvei]|uniref:Tetratricopeptide repeat protein n=1 Tax=Rhizobium alvei TaxID=1132659 RepID=A0ABT8YRU3_9HYPH|nr:tetratricopeptide repeat protein [Rhizobium alvei]MDO6966451.1 tetratricopeptide repeat protein [Rhizobium alvei]